MDILFKANYSKYLRYVHYFFVPYNHILEISNNRIFIIFFPLRKQCTESNKICIMSYALKQLIYLSFDATNE